MIMKKLLLSVLILEIILGISVTSAQELVRVGLQKQLLVDDYVIAKKENITTELGQPEKFGAVLQPTLPTDFESAEQLPDGSIVKKINYEFGRRLSVVWNDQRQLFQMLYGAGGGGTGYAESKDGIKWTKPLISENGKSNLITFRGKTHGTFFEASFMIDPTVPWGHPEKFKAAYNPGNVQCAIAHSADGMHWTGYNDGNSVTGRAADTHNQILWDSIQNRYMLLTRTDLGAMGDLKESRASRIMVHNNGNELLNYPMKWKTIAVINVDDPDHEVTKAGVPVYQMESMKIWDYENIYFGLMHVLTAGDLTGAEGRVEVADPDRRPDTDVIDFYIGSSRNGKDFDKSWIYAKKPFVPRGPAYSFDKSILEPSSEIITQGDEHFIFYTGLYSQHHSPTSAKKESGKIGLAKLPLDRFISQSAKDKLGTITTKPFELQGDNLQVNVEAEKGRFYAEVLDAEGKPIPGFTAEDAKVYNNIDELRLQPNWNSKNLSSLKGKTICLKFYLENAKLFAFQIK
jgi:hypothetical protein